MEESVILFDEAQSLPSHLAVPTLAALSHLSAAHRLERRLRHGDPARIRLAARSGAASMQPPAGSRSRPFPIIPPYLPS